MNYWLTKISNIRCKFTRVSRARYSLVTLSAPSEPSVTHVPEVALYIKGFFVQNKEPEHYEPWLSSHAHLVTKRGWGPLCYGWHWESGG